MKSALLLVTALFGADASYAQQTARDEIARYVQVLADAGQLSGTLLVARGDDVLLELAYGRADYRQPAANTPATLFAIASPTKPLTGIVARTLAERGILGLDDPVAKWIPDFPNGARITIAHLLGHRSGIPHRVTQLADEQRTHTAESMVALIARAQPRFEPGAQRMYSSAGFTLLARVLELAAGKPYAQLLREIVLAPADATAATDASETTLAGRARAHGHFWTPNGPLATVDKQLSFLVGAGSLWATPRDLFKVMRRIAAGGYGTGAVAGARTPDGRIQWSGFSNGFLSIADYQPTTDVTVIFTGNLLTGAADWIIRDVPRIIAGENVAAPVPPRPAVVTLSDVTRQRLEGVYDFGGAEQPLKFVDSSLATLGGEYLLAATSDTSFFAPQNYTEFIVL
ncbi:MAG TPA: serine hydrolase domain-containing protein, partial [Longimicrobiales bacterium]